MASISILSGDALNIENVTFENTTLEFNNAPSKKEEGFFGLFAGYIEQEATITNVAVGGTIRIGAISNWLSKYDLNLCANGNIAGITRNPVKVYVYGSYLWAEEMYEYAIDVESITVSSDGYISMSLVPSMDAGTKEEEEFYIGEY